MTGVRRQLLWAAAVVVVVVMFLVVAGRDDFREVLTSSPVKTDRVTVGETIDWHGVQLTFREPRLTDSETLDVSGVDDETQQLLVVEARFDPGQPAPESTSCQARAKVTIDGVTSEHANRFSLSQYDCDGLDTTVQYPRFVFVLPRGEISEGSAFLNFGERTTWLRVDLP